MNSAPTPPPPAPTAKSKTLWIALAGIVAAISTSMGLYADTGDWKQALPPLGAALFAAIAAALRDTLYKGQAQLAEEQAAVKEELREVKAALQTGQAVQEVTQRDQEPTPLELSRWRQAQVERWEAPQPRTRAGEPWQDREEGPL